MPKVHMVSEIDLDISEVLEGVAQLDTPELERFATQVNTLLARRRAPSLPQREAELLQSINTGLPRSMRERYLDLNSKRQAETLTPDELLELLQLIDQVEQADAERLGHLFELAQLRGVSSDVLMQQLGLQRPQRERV